VRNGEICIYSIFGISTFLMVGYGCGVVEGGGWVI
jgi:hypothetical protein